MNITHVLKLSNIYKINVYALMLFLIKISCILKNKNKILYTKLTFYIYIYFKLVTI